MSNYLNQEEANDLDLRLQQIQGLIRKIAEIAAGNPFELQTSGSNLSKDKIDQQTVTLDEKVKKYEIKLITAALIKTNGKQNKAAKLLGINHTTLNAKIKRYNLPIGKFATKNLQRALTER